MKEKMPQHAGELRVHCTRFRGNPCMYFKKDEKRSYTDSTGGDQTTCVHQSLELCRYSLVAVNLLVLALKKHGIDIMRSIVRKNHVGVKSGKQSSK